MSQRIQKQIRRQSILEEYDFQSSIKKKQNTQFNIEDNQTFQYSSQPLLERHRLCTTQCLSFQKYQMLNTPLRVYIPLCESLTLTDALPIVKEIERKLQDQKNERKNKKLKLPVKRHKPIRSAPLTQEQRVEIDNLQTAGYKNAVISSILNVTVAQVRMNRTIRRRKTFKLQIIFSNEQKQWIIDQAKQDYNNCVFNAKSFLEQFQRRFPSAELSLYQFRKLLKSLKLTFRMPQIKPGLYIQRSCKNVEVQEYIKNVSAYLQKEYKLIFIDETSFGSISKYYHKQWMIPGDFKQSIQRMSSFRCMIAAMGEEGFLWYQIIDGTGKSQIFQQFLQNILSRAVNHYKRSKFVFIFDNCTIHKSKEMKILLANIPHVFTPPYRPEFNGIEHLFGWIKRKIVQLQPVFYEQFMKCVHQSINQITNVLIDNWCLSIIKPISQELKYLDQKN